MQCKEADICWVQFLLQNKSALVHTNLIVFFANKNSVNTRAVVVVVVSMLAFYSDDLSSNSAEVYSFYSVNCLKIKV